MGGEEAEWNCPEEDVMTGSESTSLSANRPTTSTAFVQEEPRGEFEEPEPSSKPIYEALSDLARSLATIVPANAPNHVITKASQIDQAFQEAAELRQAVTDIIQKLEEEMEDIKSHLEDLTALEQSLHRSLVEWKGPWAIATLKEKAEAKNEQLQRGIQATVHSRHKLEGDLKDVQRRLDAACEDRRVIVQSEASRVDGLVQARALAVLQEWSNFAKKMEEARQELSRMDGH